MLIDITRLLGLFLQGQLPTGLSRVGLAYIRRYRPRARALIRYAGRWIVLSDDPSQRVFDALLAADFTVKVRIRAEVARAWVADGRANGVHVLINADYTGLLSPAYVHEIRRRRLCPLFFLHDLLPLKHPEYFRPGEDVRHRVRIRLMLDLGLGVIVNSQATLVELQ